jgi:hypothetical protein
MTQGPDQPAVVVGKPLIFQPSGYGYESRGERCVKRIDTAQPGQLDGQIEP